MTESLADFRGRVLADDQWYATRERKRQAANAARVAARQGADDHWSIYTAAYFEKAEASLAFLRAARSGAWSHA